MGSDYLALTDSLFFVFSASHTKARSPMDLRHTLNGMHIDPTPRWISFIGPNIGVSGHLALQKETLVGPCPQYLGHGKTNKQENT